MKIKINGRMVGLQKALDKFISLWRDFENSEISEGDFVDTINKIMKSNFNNLEVVSILGSYGRFFAENVGGLSYWCWCCWANNNITYWDCPKLKRNIDYEKCPASPYCEAYDMPSDEFKRLRKTLSRNTVLAVLRRHGITAWRWLP